MESNKKVGHLVYSGERVKGKIWKDRWWGCTFVSLFPSSFAITCLKEA